MANKSNWTSIQDLNDDGQAVSDALDTGFAALDANADELDALVIGVETIDDRVTTLEASHSLLLNSSSTASSQQPVGVNVPLQIEFGATVDTPDINLSVLGRLTFKTAGKYIIAPFFQYGRTGATSKSVLVSRWLLNGTQLGQSSAAILDSADTLVPWSSSVQFTANVGDTLDIEVMQDSSGTPSGGLFEVSPVASGWNSAPCASIQVYKAT